MSQRRLDITLTHERLVEVLHYNKRTGIFTWKVSLGRRIKVGDIAGEKPNGKGYHQIQIDGVRYYSHVLAWFYVTEEFPVTDIDHRDLSKSNNRFKNLRPATVGQNQWNCAKRSDNSSGYKGVSFQKSVGKWKATIGIRGQRIHLGLYMTPELAFAEYKKASQKYHGTFANTGE